MLAGKPGHVIGEGPDSGKGKVGQEAEAGRVDEASDRE